MRKARRASATPVATHHDDPLYPRIARAVTSILAKGKVVAPVNVLVHMGLLAPENLNLVPSVTAYLSWGRGRAKMG